jgi:ABC-type branched-subunit amino acid transport system ATPase component
MLTVKNINQYYGGSHILRDVSLSAELGKVTVMLGRNGVGKTTLLKSLMGLVPIKSGASSWTASPSRPTPYERARAWASALCHRAAKSSPPDGGRKPAHGPGVQKRRHAHSRRVV